MKAITNLDDCLLKGQKACDKLDQQLNDLMKKHPIEKGYINFSELYPMTFGLNKAANDIANNAV